MKTPESVIDRYIAAVMSLDQDAMLSLFSDEMHMFDTVTPWSLSSKSEWGRYIGEWFKAGATYAEVEATNVITRTFADSA